MQVVHHRVTDFGILAVDVPDLLLDLVAQDAVAFHPFPAGRGQLHQDGVVALDPAFGQQLGKCPEPDVDPLGVVQAVHTQQDLARAAQLGPDLFGPTTDVAVAGGAVEFGGVDGDGKCAHLDGAPVLQSDLAESGPHTYRRAGGVGAGQLSRQVQEVLRPAGQMKADQIRPEQAVDDLRAPRHLHEQLHRRERDVHEEPDGQIRPQVAQHLRDELELVVLYPHRRPRGGGTGGGLGETAVDVDVAVPPLAVVARLDDHIVIQRPQGGVGEALVVVGDVVGAESHRV